MEPAPIIIGKDYTAERPGNGDSCTAHPGGQRIVVTGASGMLGSYLVGELLTAGYTDITLLVRSLGSLDKIRYIWDAEGYPYDPGTLDIAGFHPADENAVTEVCRGADTVINCAAMVAIGGTGREDMIATNVGIARTVSRAALRAGCRLLVHISSVAALRPSPEGRIDSRSEPGYEPNASPYAESKYLSELEIKKSAREGLQTITLNPVTILGHGGTKSGSTAIIPAIARGLPVYTHGITGWVDARDAGRAIALLPACREAVGRRFVISSCNATYRRLIAEGCRAAGKKKPRVALPKPVALAASETERLYCRMTGRQRLLTPELVSILYGRHFYDGTEIKNYINFEYSPLEKTVDRLVGLYLKSRNS
ncbi:MAG: NAD-dependent epimerase/dehydratase family protein [Rikenellaceae bacterium]|nr:NAD-dependent epimerase/dehydratase family protein [Rikenellaceae bacterium]